MGGEDAVVAGDPVEGDGAVVLGAEALAAELDVGGGAEEGGEDGLHVAVPGEDGEGVVGSGEGGEGREECVFGAAEDFEGRVVVGHGCGG